MNDTGELSRWRRFKRAMLTPVGRRFPVSENGAPHGVALLTVMLALALMSAIVTDIGTNEFIRYKLAINDRDAMRAQALSEGGINMSRLLLAAQSAIQPLITQLTATGIPLPAHTIWQLIPLDSEILRGLTSGELAGAAGLDVSASVDARKKLLEEKRQATLEEFDKAKEGAGAGPFEAPEGGFGGFDGNFKVDIVDEEQKAVSLRGWGTAVSPQARWSYAQRLYALFRPERYDFLFDERDSQGNRTNRAELIANLYDWIDENHDATDPNAEPNAWGRAVGGSEDSIYPGSKSLMPKNAYFDSPGELRLVRGITDAHLRAFGDSISIYGDARINILSATQQAVEALIFMCAQDLNDPLLVNPTWMTETLQAWQDWKNLGPLAGGGPITPDGFMAFLDGRALLVNKAVCKDNINTESRNFTVKATATVGDVTRTTTVVLSVFRADEQIFYYAVR